MEKIKTPKNKRTKGKFANTANSIIAAYIEHILNNGKQPASVYKFCLDLGVKESDFYNHYGSFEVLEKIIWKGFMDQATQSLMADKGFAEFNAREKMLALYFTLAEVLKANRSFILLQLSTFKKPELVPMFLKDFKNSFEAFAGTILTDAKKIGEIADRPYLNERYPQLFWIHLSFFLIFWKNDDSAGFEKSDAFIEKSVNLAFDLIGKGAFDSAVDFAKFLYQSKVN